MADETIIVDFVANTRQAVSDADELRKAIDKIRMSIGTLMSSTKGAKLGEIVRSMLKDFKSTQFEKMGISLIENPSVLKAKMAEYNKIVAEYRANLLQAAKEYQAVEKGLSKALLDDKKKTVQEDIRLSKQKAQEHKAAIAYERAATQAATKEEAEMYRRLAQIFRGFEQQKVKEAEKSSKQIAAANRKEAQEILKAQKPTGAGAGGFLGMLNKLGVAGAFVAGVLGVTLVGAIQKVIRAFEEGIANGIDFANQIYRLGASTRALQRSGLNITMQEVIESVKELRKQFGFFSQKEAIQGVATMQLLTRSFNYTKEQMQQMTEASVVLATVTGKDFAETSRELALFLSSGYAEAMQRAGLAVNRLRVAEEAQRMGIDKGYTALTEEERAAAGLALVMRELAPITKEVENYQKSLAGQIDTTTASIEDQTNAISLQLAPLQLQWLNLKAAAINAYVDIVNAWSGFALNVYKFIVNPFRAATETILLSLEALKSGVPMSLNEFRSKMVEIGNQLNKDIEEKWFKVPDFGESGWEQAGTDIGEAIGNGAEEALKEEKIQEAFSDVMGDLVDLAKETDQDFKDAFKDYQEDVGTISDADLGNIVGTWNDFFASTDGITVENLAEMQTEWEKFFGEFGSITDEGLDKAWEIWRDYYAKLADIDQGEMQDIADANRDLADDIADAARELAQDIEDAKRDEQQKLADAARKYRENELKAERDYQEKMRRLREEFLFDLEDALREQDALQVLRLIRRYNLDKEQAGREKDVGAEERAAAYRQELEDIRRQAAQKLEELKIENARRMEEMRRDYARRIEDIHAQAAREREEAAIARDEALQKLKEDMERERAERLLKYEQEKQDIKDRFEAELAEITAQLLTQLGVTEENLDLIAGVYAKIFGKDGNISKTYDVFTAMMGDMNTVITDANKVAMDELNLLAYTSELAAARIATAAVSAAQSAAVVMTSLSQMQQANQMPYVPGISAPDPNKFNLPTHQFGGSVYANTPTVALFGDVPEIATFTPISRLTSAANAPGMSGMSGKNGSVKVQIFLSQGLEAQIIDSSLGSMAEILKDTLGIRL